MTIVGRTEFLASVSERLGRASYDAPIKPSASTSTLPKKVFGSYNKDALVNVLREQCQVIHTNFIESKKAELLEVLLPFLAGNRVVLSNDVRFKDLGLEGMLTAPIEDGTDIHVWDTEAGKTNIEKAERAEVGITFSDITLAESGTVTVLNDTGNGRSISLLPKTYVAIIPKSTLVPRMTQAMEHIHSMQQNGKNVPSCISFITGPSNSADIEMNLIVGIHGPIEVTYILVHDA